MARVGEATTGALRIAPVTSCGSGDAWRPCCQCWRKKFPGLRGDMTPVRCAAAGTNHRDDRPRAEEGDQAREEGLARQVRVVLQGHNECESATV